MKRLLFLLLVLLLIGGGVGVWYFWPKGPPISVEETLKKMETLLAQNKVPEARSLLEGLQPNETWGSGTWIRILRDLWTMGQRDGNWKFLADWTAKAEAGGFQDNRFLPYRVMALAKTGEFAAAWGLAEKMKLDPEKFRSLRRWIQFNAGTGTEGSAPGGTPYEKLMARLKQQKDPEAFRQAYDLTEDPKAAQDAMLLYLQSGDFGGAGNLAKEIKVYENDPLFWAQVYHDLGDWPTSRRILATILVQDPVPPEALLLYGDIAMMLHRWDEAIQVYRKLLGQDPRSSWIAYYNPALALDLEADLAWKMAPDSERGSLPQQSVQLWHQALEYLRDGKARFGADQEAKLFLELLEAEITYRLDPGAGWSAEWQNRQEEGARPLASRFGRWAGDNFEILRFQLQRDKFPVAMTTPRIREIFGRTWRLGYFQNYLDERKEGKVPPPQDGPNEMAAEALVWNYCLLAEYEKAGAVLDTVDQVWAQLDKGAKGPAWSSLYRAILAALAQNWPAAQKAWDNFPLKWVDYSFAYNRGLILARMASLASDREASELNRQAGLSFLDALNSLPYSEDRSNQRLRSLVHTQKARTLISNPPTLAGDPQAYQGALASWKAAVERDLDNAVRLDPENYEAFLLLRRLDAAKVEEKHP